jgi:cephalosporin hydroxylase
LISTTDPNGRKLMGYIRNIVRMRGDWNGEIISLRSQDLINLEIFSEIAPEIIQEMLITYGFPRTK